LSKEDLNNMLNAVIEQRVKTVEAGRNVIVPERTFHKRLVSKDL
jgi:hypothetical protein